MTLYELPYPPSINHFYFTRIVKGKFVQKGVGKKGKDYMKRIAELVGDAETITKPLALTCLVYKPDNRVRDLDNILKPLIDALKDAGCYEDDVLIDEIHVINRGVRKPGKVVVQLDEIKTTKTVVKE